MKRMPLNTHNNARRTLARFIKEYHRDEIDRVKFRDIVYAMSHLLGYFKLDAELSIEDRLERIEQALELRK